jgi:predicted HAD superfamily Cof-like phosphohydrolase
MLSVQRDVEEFHMKFDHPAGGKIKLRMRKLRRRLIKEESKELCRALKRKDEVEVIDGICDLIYVTVGTAVAMGIDLEPFWNEVHYANMSKDGGDPNIAALLEQQRVMHSPTVGVAKHIAGAGDTLEVDLHS